MQETDLSRVLEELDRAVFENPLPTEAEPESDESGSFVLFRAAGSTFAVTVDSVGAVLQVPPVCALPRSPRWLLGVFAWNGHVVPLVAVAGLEEVVGTPTDSFEPAKALRCLVLSSGDVRLALAVDEVIGVRRLSPGQAEIAEESTGGLSEALRWRVESDSQAPPIAAERNGETDDRPDDSAQVRVLSLVGLLASERITRFSNRAALDVALASGSPRRPYGGDA